MIEEYLTEIRREINMNEDKTKEYIPIWKRKVQVLKIFVSYRII